MGAANNFLYPQNITKELVYDINNHVDHECISATMQINTICLGVDKLLCLRNILQDLD